MPKYVPILRAKKGEFEALANTRDQIASKVHPLFEICRLTDDMRSRPRIASSQTPVMTYLEDVISNIARVWQGRDAFVDCYHWPVAATTESGQPVIAYALERLERMGVRIAPTIGYDRWESPLYQLGLRSLRQMDSRNVCLRLDSHAIADAMEPEHFEGNIEALLGAFNLDPAQCCAMIDFGDVTNSAIEQLIEQGLRVVQTLEQFGFQYYVTVGCSIPRSIDLAVSAHDTAALIARREMLVWQSLSPELDDGKIVFGDYGVRGPNSNDEIRSKYINGKIRHTVNQQMYIARGHPFSDDESAEQMHTLAEDVIASGHYLGPDFSWGDERIRACSRLSFRGNSTQWIAIDTNHHVTFVVQEIEELARQRRVARPRERASQ